MLYAQPGIRPGKREVHISLGFSDTNESLNRVYTVRSSDSQRTKREFAELWTLLSWLKASWNSCHAIIFNSKPVLLGKA